MRVVPAVEEERQPQPPRQQEDTTSNKHRSSRKKNTEAETSGGTWIACAHTQSVVSPPRAQTYSRMRDSRPSRSIALLT